MIFTVHENVLCCVWHHIIRFKVSIRKPPPARVSITIRNYKGIDSDRLSECLHHHFDAAPSAKSASDAFDWNDPSVTNALNELALVEIRSRQVRIRMPWYNDDVHSACRVRRRAERKCRKSDEDRLSYVIANKDVISQITKAKQSFFTEKLICANNKTVFQTVNRLLNNESKPLPAYHSPKELCDKFAKFLSTKF